MDTTMSVWATMVHFLRGGVMESLIEYGDLFVSHYVCVLVVKAGLIHSAVVVTHRIRKRRAASTAEA